MHFSPDECVALNSGRRSTFYFPMLLLPRLQREAVLTVYDFCRFTDDIVDRAVESSIRYNPAEKLEQWRKALLEAIQRESPYPLLNRLVETAHRFVIPFELFFELIRGVEMDLTRRRYLTFDELYLYCYRVASTPGLMTMRILGQNNDSMNAYAIHLGIAMQLTNIIRDIGDDYQQDRIYIPQEDLRRWNVAESTFAEKPMKDNFVEMLRHQIERAKSYYQKADEHYNGDCRPARAVQNIYYALLLKTEKNLEHILERRIRLSFLQKMKILIHTWVAKKITVS